MEALSRGASYVLMVDSDKQVVHQLRQHTATLQATGGEIQQSEARQFLSSSSGHGQFDIVFLDPPYGKGLIEPCIKLLEDGGWLAEHAKIYIEAEAELQDLDLPDQWETHRQLKAGQVACFLALRHPSSAES